MSLWKQRRQGGYLIEQNESNTKIKDVPLNAGWQVIEFTGIKPN